MDEHTKQIALGILRAIHADYEEALNDLFIFVAHLEDNERIIEQRTPLATAIRRL